MSENGCFVVMWWRVGESFVGENDVLRLYLSIEKYCFCSVCCTRFRFKNVSFSVSKHCKLIYAGDKCLYWSFTKWKARFQACFKFTKWKKHVSDAFSSLQNKKNTFMKRFEALFKFTKWKHTFDNRFQIYKIKNMFFKSFFFFMFKKSKTRFWRIF